MINEQRIGKRMEGSGRGLIHYTFGVCLKGLSKTTKNLSVFGIGTEI
jgi:hypothetical protein